MSETSRDLGAIKIKLAKRQQELEERLMRLTNERVSDDQVQDPGDQALSATMESLRNSLQVAEMEEYRRILAALKKIDDGSYGICLDCGEHISEKRLKLHPNAERCIICQEAFEDR